MDAFNAYQRKAVDLLLGQRAGKAFDISQEDPATRDRYGKHLWCQQALIARRLVEAGTTFVSLDLSYHTACSTLIIRDVLNLWWMVAILSPNSFHEFRIPGISRTDFHCFLNVNPPKLRRV